MVQWSIESLELDLKYTWAISRGSTTKKINYRVCAKDDQWQGYGEVAGITTQLAAEQFIINEFNKLDLNKIQSLEDIYLIDLPAPLSFAMESALIHLYCQKQTRQPWEYFNLPSPQKVQTSYSLPILATKDIEKFVKDHDLNRFSSCKIKVNKELATANCKELSKYFNGPIRVDANESFTNSTGVLEFIKQTKFLDIEFIEQPFDSSKLEDYKLLKQRSPLDIFADEFVQQQNIDSQWLEFFDGVNIKLMKAGSYHKAIEQLKAAKQFGLRTMLGCMVETSLGIYSALNISSLAETIDLDGFLFFKDEPFKLVSENKGWLQINQ